MRIRFAYGALVAAALTVAGCGSSTRSSLTTDLRNAATDVGNVVDQASTDAAEVLARNIGTQQGEEQFKNAGQELAGPLSCDAKVLDGLANIALTCSGTTKAGGVATLTGTTSELPGAAVVSLTGEFVGSVDGQQVFTTKRLGG